MITTINEFKQFMNENNSERKTTMTVEELLTWYCGCNDVTSEIDTIKDGIYTLNNNNGYDELSDDQLNNLLNNLQTTINIDSKDIHHTVDNTFELNGIEYTFDSVDFPGENIHIEIGTSYNENNNISDWDGMTAGELAEYCYNNYDKITGLELSARDDEGDFPQEIYDLMDKHNIEYYEFQEAWNDVAEY